MENPEITKNQSPEIKKSITGNIRLLHESMSPLQETHAQMVALKREIANPKAITLPFSKESEWSWSVKNNPEYFTRFPRGEMTNTYEKQNTIYNKKTRTHLVDDHGLFFYRVQKWDNLGKITDKIIALNPDDFWYLEDIQAGRSSRIKWERQSAKINGFNIPANKIKAGMWIPVPWEREERVLSEKLLMNYAATAVEQMLIHPKYSPYMKKILSKLSKRDMVSLMLATAKQESGGKPIGKNEFHRWEAHQGSFSFSMFHVLMSWPGLKARRNLEMTEWQTYHPLNACKLFLWFIIEKLIERGNMGFIKWLNSISTLSSGNFDNYATFYNGNGWKRTNPHYTKNMRKYFAWWKDLLSGADKKYVQGNLAPSLA